jgi:hypothetical protein
LHLLKFRKLLLDFREEVWVLLGSIEQGGSINTENRF